MMNKVTEISTQPHKHQSNFKQAVTVAEFSIPYYQLLDADGHTVGNLSKFEQQPERLRSLYQAMFETREFDKKAVLLQRRGQLGTYASSLGQEAIGAAIGISMQAEDVLFPAYREYAAQFLRGVSMCEILLYWGGNEQGMNFKQATQDFPINVPIASHTTHAIGAAYAFKLRKQRRVAVCVLGDGATSKGDFYEAINAAGTWNLPIVFIVNNNRWAISLPRSAQSHAQTLAQKGIAAGIPCEQVDGNDVLALTYRIGQALHKAREQQEPSLIEALSYRLCDHTTADDAQRYRSAEELEYYWRYEPLSRLHQYLKQNGYWSTKDDKQLSQQTRERVDKAVQTYLNTPAQPPESMFDYLYQQLPENLIEQRQMVISKDRHHA